MSENEFEVIDHLYFVTSFEDLKALGDFDKVELLKVLFGLITKGWVKCFIDPDNEIEVTEAEFKVSYNKYAYLATKQGMLAHNMR